MGKDNFKVLSPTAILGYGFPPESFEKGIAEKPDLVAVDAGSTDPGPYYLGSGKSFTDRAGVKRDLRHILRAAIPRKIPVVIGSAGGSGAKPHVEWCKEIVCEIAREEKLSFRLGIIYADIPARAVLDAVRSGETVALDGLPELTEKTVGETVRIVAQMGIDPFIRAIESGCDVVLAGRAYDPAVFSALPAMRGFDLGLAVHMGKILECAAIAAHPGSGADCVLGILGRDSFVLRALNSGRKFTATSTAAHTLYEKSDPSRLPGPDGVLNLEKVSFREFPDGTVEVKGSRFEVPRSKMIKLEGVRLAGYRTVSFAGVRDPILISKMETVIEDVKRQVATILESEKIRADVHFHLYGKNGVMGLWEPGDRAFVPREIGILTEVVAGTQSRADTVCSITRSTMLHYGYPGRISTAGNLAFPFSPSDLSTGAVYEFSMYHLMPAKDWRKLFRTRTENLVKGRTGRAK